VRYEISLGLGLDFNLNARAPACGGWLRVRGRGGGGGGLQEAEVTHLTQWSRAQKQFTLLTSSQAYYNLLAYYRSQRDSETVCVRFCEKSSHRWCPCFHRTRKDRFDDYRKIPESV